MKSNFKFFSIIAFILFVWNMYKQNYELSYLALIMFALCLVYALPEIIKRIKLWDWFEAELQDQINEAGVKISQIQSLAKTYGNILSKMISRNNRLMDDEDEQKQWIKDIESELEKLKISDKESSKLFNESHRLTEWDYVRSILGGGYKETNDLLKSKDAQKERDELIKLDVKPSPEELTVFMGKNGFLSDEAKRRIKDYKFYIKNQRHQRPVEWKKHESWRLTD